MRPLVVLHDLGDAAGGSPWRDALAHAGLDAVVAPDLPGHGDAAPPVGGNYVRADAGYLLARLQSEGLAPDHAVLVGVGHSGWIATVAAIGGHAAGVVLVDGLGAPWRTIEDRLADRRARTRRLLDDDAAMAHHRGPGPDPRLRHVQAPHGDWSLAMEAASLINVPALVVDPDPDSVAEVVDAFAGPVTLVRGDRTPSTVAAALGEWLAQLPG